MLRVTGRRGSVLVIDDEPLIVKVLAEVLGAEHDGSPARRAPRRPSPGSRAGERFDAIVCDLMMPQTTGMDLHETLCELAPAQARAMVFLREARSPRAHARSSSASPTGALEKPVDTDALRAKVRRLVG